MKKRYLILGFKDMPTEEEKKSYREATTYENDLLLLVQDMDVFCIKEMDLDHLNVTTFLDDLNENNNIEEKHPSYFVFIELGGIEEYSLNLTPMNIGREIVSKEETI